MWADSAEIELLGVMIRQKGNAMENAEVETKGVEIEVGVDVSRTAKCSLDGRMSCKHRAKHGKYGCPQGAEYVHVTVAFKV